MIRIGADKKSRKAAITHLETSSRVDWLEWGVFGTVFVIGIVLRGIVVSRAAIQHFDEGVYASNIYFPPPEYAYPMQRFYAPPLLPSLIEAGMISGLPPNLAALLPSFFAGCGTIAGIWWLARSWFSQGVGLAAAALVALSPFHIAFSAAALTDALLGLWLVLAVDAMARSLVKRDLRWALGAGLYTALAWWTKYNGWLPLAIEAAGVGLLWVLWAKSDVRGQKSEINGWIVSFFTTAAVAVVGWLPFFLSLQDSGGYGPIAANHAKYVVGVGGWVQSAARQVANFSVMEGRWALLALAGLSLCGIVAAAFRARRQADQGRQVGLALVAVWWAGLLVATPCYWPYPRLLLPWLLAAWLGVAMLIDEAVRCLLFLRAAGSTEAERKTAACSFAAATIAAVVFAIVVSLGRTHFGEDRRQVARIAKQMRSDLEAAAPDNAEPAASGVARVVYVFGEPAMFFQLCAAGEAVVRPAQSVVMTAAKLEGRELPTFLVTGLHSERDAQFAAAWQTAGTSWRLVGSYEYSPSAIVWLDLNDPRQDDPKRASETSFRLYRYSVEDQ